MFTARSSFVTSLSLKSLPSSNLRERESYIEKKKKRIGDSSLDHGRDPIYNNGIIHRSINKPIFPFRAINNIAARNLVRCFRRLIVHTASTKNDDRNSTIGYQPWRSIEVLARYRHTIHLRAG